MNDAVVLFRTEVRRCLSRRVVWVLVALAVVGIALTAVLVFVNTSSDDDGSRTREFLVRDCVESQGGSSTAVARCRQTFPVGSFDERLRLTDLWPEDQDEDERILGVTVIFLAIGGLLGGASMVGADWRAGTVSTLLTWEPRRVRFAVARFAAVAVCAFAIALALQMLFVVSFLPAVLAHGTTDGADAGWFRALAGAFLRSESLVAMASVFGAAIAMIGRNTAAALGASFAYMLIGENVVRAWKPWLRPWLLAENSFIFLSGFTPAELELGRGFGAAAATLLLYTAGLVAVAVASFRLRDVAAA